MTYDTIYDVHADHFNLRMKRKSC